MYHMSCDSIRELNDFSSNAAEHEECIKTSVTGHLNIVIVKTWSYATFISSNLQTKIILNTKNDIFKVKQIKKQEAMCSDAEYWRSASVHIVYWVLQNW